MRTLPGSASHLEGVGTFSLSKWYLDAISETGEVFIGYRADLRWRRMGLSYASTLTGGAHAARTRTTVRPGEDPGFLEGALAWAEPRLGVEGAWREGATPAISRTLYECPEGALIWRCLLPFARATVACHGSVLRGSGYVEHLSLTLPPWTLPLDTLRWGRFLTGAHSVVWIDWRGEAGADAKKWIFVNGTEVRGEVSEEDVFFEGGELRLPGRERLTLRRGRLADLLRNLPVSLRTSPVARALGMHETKWRTRGCLALDGAPPEGGWAIHEIVRLNS